jgi:hypothetical protein
MSGPSCEGVPDGMVTLLVERDKVKFLRNPRAYYKGLTLSRSLIS